MRGDLSVLSVKGVVGFVRREWRVLVGALLAGAGLYAAITFSDWQGRADLPSGYAVRMTCEQDPESPLWSGGCERIAADIAKTGVPPFIDLYRAFVRAHHAAIPSPHTTRRFADAPCEPGFDVKTAVKGTRFVLSPDNFSGVCRHDHARAIMDEIDERDRALLTIERAGLSYEALAAGTLANLTEPLVLLAAATVVAALWLL